MLPARSIRSFTFCPRAFWIEQVACEFVDNEHTLEGQRVHRRVDKPGGRMKAPVFDDEVWETRSLWLSSDRYRVNGKLDLVEEDGAGATLPVDTKKGRSMSGSLWQADRVQLTLQGLLLREAGYQVHRIAGYYVTERRRVYEDLTPEHIEEALAAVAGAEACAAQTEAPAPLVDSNKCYGCSLNSICLPDETNQLMREGGKAPAEPRRVIPPRADTIPLYVHSHQASLRLRKNCLVVEFGPSENKPTQEIGIEQLSHVNLFGNARLTMPALKTLLRRDIPVSMFSGGGWYCGSTISSHNRRVDVRIAQFRAWDGDQKLVVARSLIGDKIANARTFLRRNDTALKDEAPRTLKELKRLRKEAEHADSAERLLGLEGMAARIFWDRFSSMTGGTDEAMRMRGRTRRPPEDPVNAMLSYGYGVLTRDVTHAVRSVGLDPFLGMYHTPHHGRPSMALDLMEPFRPLIVDSLVWGLIARGEAKADDFVCAGQAVRMKPRVRDSLLRAYERRMDEMITHPTFGYRITYRQVLSVHARLITRYLTGEIPEPPSFRTR